MSEALDMPEPLRQWFFSNAHSLAKVSQLLHIPVVTLQGWLYRVIRVPHWQLNQILALMDLGLMPNDYGARPRPTLKAVQKVQGDVAIEMVESYLRAGRAIGNACACAAHDAGLEHAAVLRMWYDGKHKGLE